VQGGNLPASSVRKSDDKNCALLRNICGAHYIRMAFISCRRANNIMKVQDIMIRDVHTCRPETNLTMAAMQMWDGDFGVLPVLANGGTVVGMITDRDICMAAATKRRDPSTIRVEEVITGQVYGCSPDTDIHEALKIMQQRKVRRLSIMNADDGKLAGILSLNDIALKAQAEGKAELSAQDVENTLKAICAHPVLTLQTAFKPSAPQFAAVVAA
jgi:CBS-domain-containing membrane protein